MDGFDAAVNGHYDVADQLSRFLRGRAADHFEAERAEKRAIDSRAAFEARRERVREAFLSAVGGLPDRAGDPAVETTGRVERDGYHVELVVVESRPEFRVTANCYVPDGDGPHPAVLFLPGHVDAAKADPDNQRACIELALNGVVACIVDPVAQGEREQYRDPETGARLVGAGGDGGVVAHCYAGQQYRYAGANLARAVVHDARRALDYLAGRPDVDADRLGVTGSSGGGIQTGYLALVDDRVAAAAPCCAVTERSEWLATGKRIDAEQCLYGAIPAGLNHDDFVTAMAPRPVCIGAAAWDEYFPIEGVHEAHRRARRVYDLYDAAENVALVVADEPHCSVYGLGDDVLGWLCDRLGGGEYASHGDLAVADVEALWCTPEGSVRAAYPDERTVDELVVEYVAGRYPDAGRQLDPDDREVCARRGRSAVVETLDLDRERPALHPRYVDRGEEGLTVEHVFFETERDPAVVVTGVLVSDPDVPADAPAVVLFEEGTEALPERSDDAAALAAEHGTVLVFDPRGVGAVRHREIPIPAWVDDYYGVYGTEFKLAADALLLGSSLFGMRVFDVLRALEFVRGAAGREGRDEAGREGAGEAGRGAGVEAGREGRGEVGREGAGEAGSGAGVEADQEGAGAAGAGSGDAALVGEGVGAYHALYAAVADGAVGTVDLRELGPSFREMATSREYPYDPRLTAFDVVGRCDVPRCLAALADRDLRVERSVD